MQASPRDISLNGVKAFEAAARLKSLKRAAEELGVSASAVSHQVRHLEATVGAKLFVRRHNAIELTADGATFFASVSPAIDAIARAHQAVRRDASTLTVKASHSLAVCWLIPRLHDFHARHRRIRVSVETTKPPASLAPGVDIALAYFRLQQAPAGGVPLFADWSMPVCTPSVAKAWTRSGSGSSGSMLYPLISATPDNWEWEHYANEIAIRPRNLQMMMRFDTDQAAIEACLSGLGVAVMTLALIERELQSGALVPLKQFPPVKQGMYWILTARPQRPVADLFVQWLRRQIPQDGTLPQRDTQQG